MEKTITTVLLVIASIVATMALISAVVPAVGKSSSALLVANSSAADRIKTDIEIVFASGNTSTNEIILWGKNVGSKVIRPIEESDIFLTTPTSVSRVPYDGSGSPTIPYWDFIIENGTVWSQTVTIKVTLHLAGVATGIHNVTLTVYNSISATKEFSV